MIKKILTAIVVVVLIALGGIAYLIVNLDPEELGQKLIRRVNDSGVIQMQATSFEISPFHGLFIENAHVEGALASGSLSAEIGRISVDYQFLPILRGEVIVDRILVEEPRLTIVSTPSSSEKKTTGGGRKKERQGDDSASEEGSVSQKRIEANVSIAEFRIENGTVVLRIEGPSPEETTITGLDLRLKEFRLDSSAAEPILGLTGQGSIEIDRIVTDDLQLEGSHGRIEIDRGRVSISDLGVETRNASLEISALGLNLRREPPPFNLQAGGEYDLNAFVEEGATRSFGPASLQMSLSGEAPSVDQISGDGTLRLESGEIPAFPMVTLIEHILGENLITGSRYQATDIAFTVESGRIHVQPFTLPVEDMQISGLGTIELAGPLNLEISVRLPRDRVDIEALEGAIDGLTEDGYTTLPFNVTGTAGDPEVTIDSSLYKDAVKGMGKKALGGLLDRVFDNDDSN